MRFLKRNTLKSSEIVIGEAVFDRASQRLRDNFGQDIPLRYRSRMVLACLVSNRGAVVTRAQLIRAVWDVAAVSNDSVAQCIADIRRAIGDTGKVVVETVPRQGYRLFGGTPPFETGAKETSCPADVRTDETAHRSDFQARQSPAPVIAVLPFEDHGIAGVAPGSLRAALVEAIITDLARHPEMTVISRFESNRWPARHSIRVAATQLKADYLVTGTLWSDGDMVRTTVQLVSGEDLTCLWVDGLDIDLGDLFAFSRFIGRHVANVVGAKLIDMAEARLNRGHVSAMLIENAARSRMLRFRSRDAWRRNIEEQEAALQRFPDASWGNFGQALALQVGIAAGWQRTDVDEALARAETLVARALAIAPGNYLSHYALGKTLVSRGEMKRAVIALEHAARLNPASTLVLAGLIEPYLSMDETGKALEVIALAEKIDPFHTYELPYKKAWAYWQGGDPHRALEILQGIPNRSIEHDRLLSIVHLELGNRSTAREVLTRFLAANNDWTLKTERKVLETHWTPAHLQDAWISGLSMAGMPG